MMFVLGCSKHALNTQSTTPKHETIQHETIHWRTFNSFAALEAKATGKLVILDFTSETCGPCRLMERTTFKDPDIVRMLNELFIPIRLQGEQYIELMQLLKIENAWPNTVLMTPEGDVLFSIAGYVGPTNYRRMLEKIIYLKKIAKTSEAI